MTRVWQETSQLSNPLLRDPAYAPGEQLKLLQYYVPEPKAAVESC
jgi:hypothetical protein